MQCQHAHVPKLPMSSSLSSSRLSLKERDPNLYASKKRKIKERFCLIFHQQAAQRTPVWAKLSHPIPKGPFKGDLQLYEAWGCGQLSFVLAQMPLTGRIGEAHGFPNTAIHFILRFTNPSLSYRHGCVDACLLFWLWCHSRVTLGHFWINKHLTCKRDSVGQSEGLSTPRSPSRNL